MEGKIGLAATIIGIAITVLSLGAAWQKYTQQQAETAEAVRVMRKVLVQEFPAYTLDLYGDSK